METKPKRKSEDALNEIAGRGKDLLEQSNSRRFVLRTADGSTLIDVSLTVAVVIGLVVLLMVPGGLMLGIVATIVGIAAKLRVEILRELDDNDNVIEMPRDES